MEYPLSIISADSAQLLSEVKNLLEEYGNTRIGDPALTSYREEIAQLPGVYGPPEGIILLALWNGQAAGCVALKKLGEKIGEVKRLYVSPAYRKKGIARKLMERLLIEAEGLGYQLIRLDSIPKMKAAQHLYERMGFEEIAPYWQNPNPGTRYFEWRFGD